MFKVFQYLFRYLRGDEFDVELDMTLQDFVALCALVLIFIIIVVWIILMMF